MALLRKDLDDIRRIVREELETFMDALEEFEAEVAESPAPSPTGNRVNVHGLEITDHDLPENLQAAPARVVEETPPPPPPPPQEPGVATPSVAVQELEPVGRPFIVRKPASDQGEAQARLSRYDMRTLTAWVLKRTGAQRIEDIPEADLNKILGEVDYAIARGPEFVTELMGQEVSE